MATDFDEKNNGFREEDDFINELSSNSESDMMTTTADDVPVLDGIPVLDEMPAVDDEDETLVASNAEEDTSSKAAYEDYHAPEATYENHHAPETVSYDDYQIPEDVESTFDVKEVEHPAESMSDVQPQAPVVTAAPVVEAEPEAPKPVPEEKKAAKVKPEKEKKSGKKAKADTLYGLTLAKGEKFVKDYNFINSGKLGLAVVTNKRFIIKSKQYLETSVDSVKAIRCCKFTQFKGVKFIFGLIFLAALVACVLLKLPNMFPDKLWLAYLILGVAGVLGLIGFIMICTSFKKRFAINIFTQDLTEFASFHSSLKKKEEPMFVNVIEAKPGKEYAEFTKEIGALLIDIQNGVYED